MKEAEALGDEPDKKNRGKKDIEDGVEMSKHQAWNLCCYRDGSERSREGGSWRTNKKIVKQTSAGHLNDMTF